MSAALICPSGRKSSSFSVSDLWALSRLVTAAWKIRPVPIALQISASIPSSAGIRAIAILSIWVSGYSDSIRSSFTVFRGASGSDSAFWWTSDVSSGSCCTWGRWARAGRGRFYADSSFGVGESPKICTWRIRASFLEWSFAWVLGFCARIRWLRSIPWSRRHRWEAAFEKAPLAWNCSSCSCLWIPWQVEALQGPSTGLAYMMHSRQDWDTTVCCKFREDKRVTLRLRDSYSWSSSGSWRCRQAPAGFQVFSYLWAALYCRIRESIWRRRWRNRLDDALACTQPSLFQFAWVILIPHTWYLRPGMQACFSRQLDERFVQASFETPRSIDFATFSFGSKWRR